MEGIVQAVAFTAMLVIAFAYMLFGRSAGKLLLWVMLPVIFVTWVYCLLAR